MRHYFLTVREVTRLTRVLEPALVRAALGPPAIARRDRPGAGCAAGFVLADGKLLSAPGPRLPRRADPDAAHPAGGARPQPRAAPAGDPRADPQRAPRAVLLRGDPEAAALFLDLLCGRDAEHNRADGARWLAILNETGFLGRYLPDWARIVGQMQFDTYHVFTVDEHTIEAVRVLQHAGARRTGRDRAGRLRPDRPAAVAPRAVRRDAAARHRQGPRRRPFGTRRRAGAGDRPGARPVGGGDRDGLLAGAAPPAAEPDRVQARHRRPEDHPRPRRHDPVARAAAAAAGADGRRHARGVAEGLERLEGDAAARAVRARGARCWPAGCRPPSATCAWRAPRRPPPRCWTTGREADRASVPGARLSRLLAVLRSRDPCPPRPPDPRRRSAATRR